MCEWHLLLRDVSWVVSALPGGVSYSPSPASGVALFGEHDSGAGGFLPLIGPELWILLYTCYYCCTNCFFFLDSSLCYVWVLLHMFYVSCVLACGSLCSSQNPTFAQSQGAFLWWRGAVGCAHSLEASVSTLWLHQQGLCSYFVALFSRSCVTIPCFSFKHIHPLSRFME